MRNKGLEIEAEMSIAFFLLLASLKSFGESIWNIWDSIGITPRIARTFSETLNCRANPVRRKPCVSINTPLKAIPSRIDNFFVWTNDSFSKLVHHFKDIFKTSL